MIHMTEAGSTSFGAPPALTTRPLPPVPQTTSEQQDFIESDPIAQYSNNSSSSSKSTTISSKIKSSVSHAFQGKTTKRKFKRSSSAGGSVEDECCCNVLPIMVAGLTVIGWVVGAVVTLPYLYSTNMTVLIIHEIIGVFEVTMLLLNYFKCMKTNPGIVQPDWHENLTEEEKETILSMELNKEGKPRYCHTCGTYKPPRAHHSSFQNKCVLKMDHYCIWVNNVVGMFNHKFFYLFLFYAVMAMAHYYIVAISGFVKFAMDPEGFNPLVFILLLVCSVFLCPMGLMVFAFLVYQTYLICSNQTSIEFHNNSEVMSKLKFKLKKRVELKHIYQIGIVENIKNFLGSKPLFWLLPTKFEGSDGIHFKTIAATEMKKTQTYTVEAAIYSSGEEDNGDHYGSGDESAV